MTTQILPPRVEMLGVELDPITMQQAVDTVLGWTRDEQPCCRYVVTPNVDHIVLLQHHTGLQAAYEDADLILADGAPVVWASHLLGRKLPDRIPGSDLTPAIFAAVLADQPLKVYLLGAMPGVAEVAAANIERRWPAVRSPAAIARRWASKNSRQKTTKFWLKSPPPLRIS
jgi:N-acetylglucosaminyldiphosphoundecaprenol N-acetyl-beta-D-mannosaminyltransferase